MVKQSMKGKNTAQLSYLQKSIVVASLLGDSWLDTSPNGKTARIGLEITSRSEDLLLH